MQRFRDLGRVVTVTREPGGTPLAESLRALILNEPMDTLTETLLAFAARRDHLVQLIRPALARGEVVICDRFTDSTYAYQGSGRGLADGENIISQLEQWVQIDAVKNQISQPDLTLWFDVEPVIASARIAGARAPDRFEQQALEFFERVRAGYSERMRLGKGRIVRIDANQSPLQVFKNVWSTCCSARPVNELASELAG